MNEGTLALMIPYAVFLLIGLVIWMTLHFRHKSKAEIQQTIRLAMDKGNELTPELIAQVGTKPRHPQRDLRLGTALIAIALGLALMGFFVPDPSNSAFQAALAVAAIPLMIGLAYLAMYRLTEHNSEAG